MKCIISLLLLTIEIFWSSCSYSAAWLQKKGETQIINTTSQYKSDRYFNSSGESTKSNIKFSKKELNIYYEKGITDKITFGYNSFIQEQNFAKENPNDPVFDFSQCGLLLANQSSNISVRVAELELFFRKKLYQKDRLILSVEPILKLPCLLIGGGVDFVDDTTDVEIKFLAGYDFQTSFFGKTQNNFVNSELSYRKRHTKFADQLRLDNTYGIHLDDNNMLMAQAFAILSLGEEDARGVIGANGLVTENANFNSLQMKASYVRKMKKGNSVQFSYLNDVLGTNSAKGSSFLISLWQKF